MSSVPASRKFVSVEGSDIHSRSKPDGNEPNLDFPISFEFDVVQFSYILSLLNFNYSGFRFSLVSYNILAQVH